LFRLTLCSFVNLKKSVEENEHGNNHRCKNVDPKNKNVKNVLFKNKKTFKTTNKKRCRQLLKIIQTK